MIQMEEIKSFSDGYRSSCSSPSSPAGRKLSENYIFLRNPGSFGRPISFHDSPEWDEAEIDAQLEEGVEAINAASIAAASYLSKGKSIAIESPSLHEISSSLSERKISGASVVWKDLTVIVKGKRNYSDQIVKSSSGFALPGTLTVIMGPARSGKSTLLRAIAGKLPSKARVYGEVYVNGMKERMPYGTYGFVERDDTLIESLTVREYLSYSALLQLPGWCDNSTVEDVIQAMSLADYSDKVIGGRCYKKGLSSGERRRISVARELVTRPHILFVDEPLYNLDSVSALLMMVTLKKLASTGFTIVFTMYQSSTEVFGLFDRICLLSNGNTLFFGETLACLQHFSNSGFPCPIMQSPSDHFLRAINTDFDRIIAMCKNFQEDHGDFSSVNMDTAVAIRTLEATYKVSSESFAVESMIEKLIKKDGPLLKGKGKVNSAIRTAVLTWRSLLIMSREWRYFWLRIVLSLLLALCTGTMFSNLGHTLSSVMPRISSIFVFISFTSLTSIAGLPALIKEFKAFSGEESNGHSGPLIFLLGHLVASIPFLFLLSISSSLIFYFLVGLKREFGSITYFVLNVFSCLLANDGLMMVVSYLWKELFQSTMTIVFVHAVMMLAAGYFRMHGALPRPIWRYPLSYAALHTYSIQGLLENEYLDAEFALGEVRTIPGMQALHGLYPISAARDGKWANLLVLVLMAVTYRAVLLALLLCRSMRRR